MRNAVRPISDLKPNPANPKGHDLGAIITSLKTHGFVDAPVVDDRTGLILGGHGRVEALLAMHKAGEKPPVGVTVKAGKWCIPIQHARTRNDGQAAALMLALNRTVELGGSDDEKLAALLKALHASGDLPGSGYDSDDLDQLLKDLGKGDKGEDEIPEPPKKPITKPGQIWLLGDHRLLCGDSTQAEDVGRLMGGDRADVVYADPPYGMDLDTDFSTMRGSLKSSRKRTQGHAYPAVIGDDAAFDPTPIFTLWPKCSEVILWGADYYAARLPRGGSWFVWDKRLEESADKMFGSCFELCWSKVRHKREIARIKWAGFFGTEKEPDGKRCHPTQKPVALALWFLSRTKGQRIVDPYCGSGSTLIAAEQTERRCYAIEIAPAYCDVIVERWEKFSGRKVRLQKPV